MANLFTLARKGTDIASAATITPPEDGDRFAVTGTTGITAVNQGSRSAGARIYLVFDGVVTVTHATTTLELQGDADFTSAANDVLGLERTTGGWIEFHRWRAAGSNFGGQMVNLGTATELTIATGSITVTQSWHTVDTESDAAGDDLQTIAGGTNGDLLWMKAENSGRTVTLKHLTDNIKTSTGADAALSFDKVHHAVYDGNHWLVIVP